MSRVEREREKEKELSYEYEGQPFSVWQLNSVLLTCLASFVQARVSGSSFARDSSMSSMFFFLGLSLVVLCFFFF